MNKQRVRPEPPQMTWGRASFVLVIALLFDVVRAFFQFFWLFGPALLAAGCAAGTMSFLGADVSTFAGKTIMALCAGGAVTLGALAATPLMVFGNVMGMAMGLLGWMTVGTITLVTNRRLYTEHFGSTLWMLGSLAIAELPFIGALPSLTIAMARLHHMQIKNDKAARKKWRQETEALRKREQDLSTAQMQQQALVDGVY